MAVHCSKSPFVCAALALLSAGCASGLGSGGPSLPELPPLPTVGSLPELPTLAPSQPKIVGTPTELYTRIARGAMTCWFAGGGPLKSKYIYNAEAESPASGGRAEIVIHERDTNAQQPRGVRAFKIAITPAGETAELAVETHKLSEPLSKAMTEDVYRWAAGEVDCAKGDPKSAWAAVSTDAVTEAATAEAAKAPAVTGKRQASKAKEKR